MFGMVAGLCAAMASVFAKLTIALDVSWLQLILPEWPEALKDTAFVQWLAPVTSQVIAQHFFVLVLL